MSHTTLYEFRDGLPKAAAEYKNAWGSAAFVWTAMYDRYLKDPLDEYDSWLVSASKPDCPLWDLPRSDKASLQLFERAVLASTFDRAIVIRRNFELFATHLRKFVAEYRKADGACHLLDWADFVSISVADAIGFHQTSGGDDPWFEIGEAGELVPYNIRNGRNHFEVYAWLKVNGVGR
jgi:hypothetical protein